MVDVWYADPDALTPALAARARALLSPDERTRLRRLHPGPARHLYLVSRLLVRSTLSRYAPVTPADWRFTRGLLGRPELANGHGGASGGRLRFNLSHTRGLVVCAVARGAAVGVDVEELEQSPPLAAAELFFAPAEARVLRRVPRARRGRAFLVCWTLKESYLKARGWGLTHPLRDFAISRRGAGARLFTGRGADDSWQFAVRRPTRNHVVAVCVRGLSRRKVVFSFHRFPFPGG